MGRPDLPDRPADRPDRSAAAEQPGVSDHGREHADRQPPGETGREAVAGAPDRRGVETVRDRLADPSRADRPDTFPPEAAQPLPDKRNDAGDDAVKERPTWAGGGM